MGWSERAIGRLHKEDKQHAVLTGRGRAAILFRNDNNRRMIDGWFAAITQEG
jgi:hypothetical protein